MKTLTPGSRVGPYEIVAPLRTGGMAALYLGRRVGPAGFEKPIAIKVIHAHLARDETFVQMFLDEARLAGRISDPNVVRVEALGEADGMFYLAMEYVLGTSLAGLVGRMSDAGRRLAPTTACAIAIEIANGLHAAHELVDDEGAPLEVVHRDVSPQNVLISRSGHVKVIDFGVALSRSHLRETEGGSLKGKLAYMSPEQAWGRPIDRRADVFALGVVLWEMLTMRRLFGGGTDIDRLERVRSPGPIPSPSLYAPDVSREVDTVVLKALSVDVEARYPTAKALRLALVEACPDGLRVHPEDLAALVETYVGADVAEEQAALKSFSVRWLEPAPSPAEAQTVAARLTRESLIDAEDPALDAGVVARRAPDDPPASPRWRGPVAAMLGMVGAAVGVLAGLWFLDAGPSEAVSAEPPESSAVVEGCGSARGVEVEIGQPSVLALDTRGQSALFQLPGARNEDVLPAPQVVLEHTVAGSGPLALELSTVGTGTDARFDTMVAVFRGRCSEAMYTLPPDVTIDDQGREFRARGVVAVEGGETLTIVVAGWGGGLSNRVDRGLVELSATLRSSVAPELGEISVVLAEHELHVHARGADPDGDVEGLEVVLLDEAGAPIHVRQHEEGILGMARLALPAGDGQLRSAFQRSVQGVPTFEERSMMLARPGDHARLELAARAEVRAIDASGRRSAPRSVDVVRGSIQGAGDECGGARVCAEELDCSAEGRCAVDVERSIVCQRASAFALAATDDGGWAGHASGGIGAGPGRFAAQCLRRWTDGREDLYRLTIPPGRWDVVLTTDTEGPADEDRTRPDTVLYVRRACVDARDASAPDDWCNDDVRPGGDEHANQRSRVTLRDMAAGDVFVFVELWGSALPDSEERYDLSVSLTPSAADAP